MTTIKDYNKLATAEITHNGQTHALRDWADILDIPYATLRMRYSRGIRGEDLLHKTTQKLPRHYDRLKLLDPTLKVKLIDKANELGIDPMELMHNILSRNL